MKIKIPKGLALKVCNDRQLLKLVGFYCFLKALCPEGRFVADVATIHAISDSAGVGKSPKTIRRLLAKLESANLIALHGKTYTLASWEAIKERFDFKRINFHWVMFSPDCKLEYIMFSIVIKEQEAKQRKACAIRLQSNQYVKQEWATVAGPGCNAENVAHHQLACFLSGGKMYSAEQHYLLSLKYYDRQQELLRGDTATSTRKFNRMLGYSGHGSFTYIKRQLRQGGYVHIEHRVHDLRNGLATSTQARKVRLGFVKWNEAEHKLQLVMPDVIAPVSLMQLPEALAERKRQKDLMTKMWAEGGTAAPKS